MCNSPVTLRDCTEVGRMDFTKDAKSRICILNLQTKKPQRRGGGHHEYPTVLFRRQHNSTIDPADMEQSQCPAF
jgi:hypothetical protein